MRSLPSANERAIREYGRLEYEYSENNLIQIEPQARAIAEGILKAFSGTQRHGEISTFGDVTCRIGDIWNVPEYQKRGIDNRGIYVVTRLSTDYDGSLRQAITCRRIGDVPPPLTPFNFNLIIETGSADITIIETGDAPEVIAEGDG